MNHPSLIPAALVVDDEQRVDVGEDIDERLWVRGIGGQSGLWLQHQAHRTHRRQSAIRPGGRQLHWSLTPGNVVVKTFGSKPLVSSK